MSQSARLIRRFVDEYSWEESVQIDFIRPRGLEDCILDDQIYCRQPLPLRSLRMELPDPTPKQTPTPDVNGRPLTPPPLPQQNQKLDDYRPPTPPKARDSAANSPRKSSPERSGDISVVPIRSSMKKNPLASNLKRIDEKGDDGSDRESVDEKSQSSLSQPGNLFVSLAHSPVVRKLVEAAAKRSRVVQFADEVELNEISKLQASALNDLFYGSEDLAEFRYEAFMEEAGLDPSQFD